MELGGGGDPTPQLAIFLAPSAHFKVKGTAQPCWAFLHFPDGKTRLLSLVLIWGGERERRTEQ